MTDIIDMKRPGEKALQLERKSLEVRSAALSAAKEGDHLSPIWLQIESVALNEQAKELRQVDEIPSVGAGGEFLPTAESDQPSAVTARDELLHHPDAVNIGASEERLGLLIDAGVSQLGIDAAESAGAQNSLEKMLSHQMALCHDAAFKAISQARGKQDTVDQVRLLNAGARLMETYQKAMLTLHKVRTGGKQVVVVQHVNVTEGGQAVIAGSVGGGGESGGG
jgi:hypothetical protein